MNLWLTNDDMIIIILLVIGIEAQQDFVLILYPKKRSKKTIKVPCSADCVPCFSERTELEALIVDEMDLVFERQSSGKTEVFPASLSLSHTNTPARTQTRAHALRSTYLYMRVFTHAPAYAFEQDFTSFCTRYAIRPEGCGCAREREGNHLRGRYIASL